MLFFLILYQYLMAFEINFKYERTTKLSGRTESYFANIATVCDIGFYFRRIQLLSESLGLSVVNPHMVVTGTHRIYENLSLIVAYTGIYFFTL